MVGRFQKATKELANRAVDTAYETFKTWSTTPAQERAELLFRVANLLRQRKHEYSAWMIHEVAKTWPEADGDTAEAIPVKVGVQSGDKAEILEGLQEGETVVVTGGYGLPEKSKVRVKQ